MDKLGRTGSVTILFVGGHYEVKGSEIIRYYGVYPECKRRAGSTRIATLAPGASAGVRKYIVLQNMIVEYLLADPLGSTSITTDSGGAKIAKMRYTAWGEVRYTWGSTPTDYTYTGQYSNVPEFGLMFYNARWYDPYITHFSQPDTIVPDPYNPQDWNRYSYARGNPLKYTDPSGHMVTCDLEAAKGCDGFGPDKIIKAGFDDETTSRYLRNFIKARPNYQVEYDPFIYGQDGEFLVRTAQFQVEAEKPIDLGDGTVQVGIGGEAFIAKGVRADISLGIDGKGNLGIFLSVGGGGYSAVGASAGPFVTATNAPTLNDLNGWSVQTGGAIGQGSSIAVEKVFFKSNGKTYHGSSLSGGPALYGPWPGEFHGTFEYTWSLRLNTWR